MSSLKLSILEVFVKTFVINTNGNKRNKIASFEKVIKGVETRRSWQEYNLIAECKRADKIWSREEQNEVFSN